MDDIRKDLEAAFDAAQPAATVTTENREPPLETVSVPATPIGDNEPTTTTDGKPRDDKGRFAPKIGDKPPEPPKEVAQEGKVVAQPPPAEPTPTPAPAVKDLPPPRSLAAPLREAWKKLDPTEREYLLKREGEVARLHNETQEARQGYSRFKEMVAPLEPIFRAEGVDTLQGVRNTMAAMQVLAQGNDDHKADLIANLITRYRVDIARLDARLSGQVPAPQVSQASQVSPDFVASQAQEAVKRTLAELQENAARQKAAEAFDEFMSSDPEFYEDLKDDMMKLLESGFAKDYKDAYNKAQALNPAVSRVIEQRKAAANQGSTQRAQVAASSIRPQPTASIKAPSGGDLRSDLEEAWDRLNGR